MPVSQLGCVQSMMGHCLPWGNRGFQGHRNVMCGVRVGVWGRFEGLGWGGVESERLQSWGEVRRQLMLSSV